MNNGEVETGSRLEITDKFPQISKNSEEKGETGKKPRKLRHNMQCKVLIPKKSPFPFIGHKRGKTENLKISQAS